MPHCVQECAAHICTYVGHLLPASQSQPCCRRSRAHEPVQLSSSSSSPMQAHSAVLPSTDVMHISLSPHHVSAQASAAQPGAHAHPRHAWKNDRRRLPSQREARFAFRCVWAAELASCVLVPPSPGLPSPQSPAAPPRSALCLPPALLPHQQAALLVLKRCSVAHSHTHVPL